MGEMTVRGAAVAKMSACTCASAAKRTAWGALRCVVLHVTAVGATAATAVPAVLHCPTPASHHMHWGTGRAWGQV